MGQSKSEVYKEEFAHVFSKKAFRVRGAVVISALIEGQVLLLAESFLEERKVKLEQKGHRLRHRQALDILKYNGIITAEEHRNIDHFQKERNRSIHGPFKGMTRTEWEEQNNNVVELGRPIVEILDKKLFPV